MADVTGKVIIVTGAARGLGRAMAEGLVRAGANVVGIDLPGEAELDAASRTLGASFHPVGANIADPADCARAIASGKERFGTVHALVNNAGVGMQLIKRNFASDPTRFWDLTPEQYRHTMETNAFTQFYMARAVAPTLLAQRWGRIINVTTSFPTMVMTGMLPYGPSKAAAEATTSIMAKDLIGTGVTANVLIPGGAADTRMVTDDVTFPDRSKLVRPAKMIAPVAWLCSDASNGVNGRRFVAQLWDESLAEGAAAVLASAQVAW